MNASPVPRMSYARIAWINRWLDYSNSDMTTEVDDMARVLKVAEEAGEAASAYIGMIGQNPRKGVTATMEDVLSELADVAITAMCAIQHFTQNTIQTERIMDDKINAIVHQISIGTPKGGWP